MTNDIKNILINFTGDKNKRYLYRDVDYDTRGINYKSFLKIRYDTINLLHIKDKYSVTGWYIMFYLITKAKDYKFISTSPRFISNELNLTLKATYKALNILFKSEIIQGYINKKEYSNKHRTSKVDDVLDIAILYGDDNVYPYDNRGGYRPVPLDFISRIIKDLTPEEFGMYCVLLVRYRYFLINPTVTEDGEFIKTLNDTEYAFPQIEKISDALGVNKRTIMDARIGLVEKNFIKTKFNESAPKVKVNGILKHKDCYRYYINLLERSEYKCHYILDMPSTDEEKRAIKMGVDKYISQNIYNNEELITPKLYILSRYDSKDLRKYFNEYS